MYKGFAKLGIGELFAKDSNIKDTRGHSLKLEKLGCVRDSRKYFFSHRLVRRCNALDQHTVDAPSISAFKGRLDKLRQTRVGLLWINEPSTWPNGTIGSPVRPHKVRYKVR